MSKKSWIENKERKASYDLKQKQLAEATTDAQRRAINLAIPDSEISWIKRHHKGLEDFYRDYVTTTANTLDKAAKFMSMKYGVNLDKGHLRSAAGGKDNPYEMTGKLTPTTSYDSAGPNDVGMSEVHASNIRHGNKNLLTTDQLDELGVSSTWQYSSTNFVADRPDIRDPLDRAKMGLEPLGPKPSQLGLNKLALGELDVDDLQAKMWLEREYKNAGIELDPDQKADLGAFFRKERDNEMVINADKHSWKRRSSDKFTADGQVVWKRGDLVLDKNNQPIRENNWSLDKKGKFDPSNDRFDQRFQESQNSIKRQNPTITKLPPEPVNGTNGTNGTNGSKLNGKVKNGNGKKLLGLGVVGGTLTNFMPTKAAAEEIYQEIQDGNFGEATKTYGKDLVVGQSTSRAMGSAVKMLQSQFGKKLSKGLARKALQIAGRQLVKKGAALAGGPTAPIIMTSLLIKDAYDVANALSGGALEPGKPTATNRKRFRHGRK